MYRWTRDKPLIRVGDDNIQRGEEFEPSDAVVDRYSEWLESVESDANPEGASGEDTVAESLEDKEYSELREMAMNADTDEINGRSSKDEIVAYFTD